MTPERREILQLEVHTSSSHTQVDLAEDLSIDTADLNTAYIEQPGKFAYWATVALQAKHAYDQKKQEVSRQEDFLRKTLFGKLDAEIRVQLELDGERITEARVANQIYIHRDYLAEQATLYQLQDELLELQERYQQLEVAREAMYQRKDMLISLGAQIRAEGNNIN